MVLGAEFRLGRNPLSTSVVALPAASNAGPFSVDSLDVCSGCLGRSAKQSTDDDDDEEPLVIAPAASTFATRCSSNVGEGFCSHAATCKLAHDRVVEWSTDTSLPCSLCTRVVSLEDNGDVGLSNLGGSVVAGLTRCADASPLLVRSGKGGDVVAGLTRCADVSPLSYRGDPLSCALCARGRSGGCVGGHDWSLWPTGPPSVGP